MLTDSPLVYLMIYVSDLAKARVFYEQKLGFPAIEEDDSSVKYDAGNILLCLNLAAHYGIALPSPRDRSAEITFLVRDLDHTRQALEQRGVVFTPTQRYDVGAITDFYDQDGHWFSLYEPSEEALEWTSGEKVRAMLNTYTPPDSTRLDGTPLIYLFLFVRDTNATFAFYHDALGLDNIEGGQCSSNVSVDEEGVVKYDAGGPMIATHHVDEAVAVARGIDPTRMQSIAPVFYVADVASTSQELAARGVKFSLWPTRSQIGVIARFEEPGGRSFYLYEPSTEAMNRLSGHRIQQILAAAQRA